METKPFNLKFIGRRELTFSKKRTMYIYGLILVLLGIWELIASGFELKIITVILIIGGLLNFAHAFWGKELIKEKNYISIKEEEIEYKNSFKKRKKIKTNDLPDLRIENAMVEFVHNDQRVESYNFSVFKRQELEDIYKELERIKTNLIK